MPTYSVTLNMTCSVTIGVDAETPEQAAENVWDHDHMPGGLTYRAFNENVAGGAPSVDGGEWYPVSVTDTDGNLLLDEEALA